MAKERSSSFPTRLCAVIARRPHPSGRNRTSISMIDGTPARLANYQRTFLA